MASRESMQKIAQLLENLVRSQIMEKTEMDIYISKYSKAYDLLQQAANNERTHAQNIQDLSELIQEQELEKQQAQSHQNSQNQRIFQLRQQLQDKERNNSTRQEMTTLTSNILASLGEEKMCHEQTISLLKRQRVEDLEPKILELNAEKLKLELRKANLKTFIANTTAQLQGQTEELNLASAALILSQQELQRQQQELQIAKAQPERQRREAALMKQGQEVAQLDVDHVQQELDAIAGRIAQSNKLIGDLVQQINQLNGETSQIKYTQISQIVDQIEATGKQLTSAKFSMQQILQDNAQLQQQTLQVKQQRDGLAKRHSEQQLLLNQLEKQLQNEQLRLQQRIDLVPSYQNALLDEKDDHQKEVLRQKTLQQQRDKLETLLKDVLIDRTVAEASNDRLIIQVMEQHQLNRESQRQIYALVGEMRELQIQTIAIQSQRQAGNQRQAKLQGQLKQLVDELQVKDSECDRLTVENNDIQLRIRDFEIKYERLKTDKNKLQRLSQEAKLAIQEVGEKIEVLKSETNVLTQESSSKQQILNKQAIETKDAQRQAQTVRQTLSNERQQLRDIHQQMTRQISEVKALGETIIQREKQIYLLKENYIKCIEERNQAGQQLIQRNDDLSRLYDKLHTQEAVMKEAEAYLRAREEDGRVLTLMLQELQRDKELLQRKATNDCPALVAERDELLGEVAEIKTENELLLNDIRTTAAVKTGQDQVQLLDLASLYAPQSPSTIKRPPQQLNNLNNKVFATWNMVGSLKAIDPAALSDKQKKIERYIQQVSHDAREKLNLKDELSAMVDELQTLIDERKNQIAGVNVVGQLNEVRQKLTKTTRQLLSTAGQIQLKQMTCLSLEKVAAELQSELEAQKQNMQNGGAPSEEVEHEWLVQNQNKLDYLRQLRLRQEIINAQVPGIKPTQAKPRFDSYVDVQTGLPKPYGASAPLEPRTVGVQQQRFVKKPKPYEIEL